jgi:hypothetical protein
MPRKTSNLVLVVISFSLTTLLTRVWQNQSFIMGNFAVLAEVPSVASKANERHLSQPNFPLQDKALLMLGMICHSERNEVQRWGSLS